MIKAFVLLAAAFALGGVSLAQAAVSPAALSSQLAAKAPVAGVILAKNGADNALGDKSGKAGSDNAPGDKGGKAAPSGRGGDDGANHH